MQPLQMKYWMLVHFEARCRMPSSVIREHHDMLIDSRWEQPRLQSHTIPMLYRVPKKNHSYVTYLLPYLPDPFLGHSIAQSTNQLMPKFHYADFATKSATSSRQSRGHKSWKSTHKSRCRLSWFVSSTVSPTFPMHCNGLNSIKVTQTSLSQTCHELCHKHLDMSRWFVSMTFVTCVSDFHKNFMISWFVTVYVHDFHDLCPRLSLQGSFSESWRNEIWALVSSPFSKHIIWLIKLTFNQLWDLTAVIKNHLNDHFCTTNARLIVHQISRQSDGQLLADQIR